MKEHGISRVRLCKRITLVPQASAKTLCACQNLETPAKLNKWHSNKPSYTVSIVSTLVRGLGPEQPTVDKNLNFFLIASIIDLSCNLESINLDVLGEAVVLGLAIIPIHSAVIVIRKGNSASLVLSARPTATISTIPNRTQGKMQQSHHNLI